ncbi:hypothetical protein AOLI_G00212910, partial [Acnodon oligacanthus]
RNGFAGVPSFLSRSSPGSSVQRSRDKQSEPVCCCSIHQHLSNLSFSGNRPPYTTAAIVWTVDQQGGATRLTFRIKWPGSVSLLFCSWSAFRRIFLKSLTYSDSENVLTEAKEQGVHTHCIDAEEAVCNQVGPEYNCLSKRDAARSSEGTKCEQERKPLKTISVPTEAPSSYSRLGLPPE